MRRAKIISAISLMILCVCMLSVGIIASNGSKNENMGMGGVINVPSNKIGVTVKAYIIEGVPTANDYSSAVTPDFDSSLAKQTVDVTGKETCCGETWIFTEKQLQKMTFNMQGVNDDEDLQKVQITIVFVIQNSGSLELETKFTKPNENNDGQADVGVTEILTYEENVEGQTEKVPVDTVSVTFNTEKGDISSQGSGECSMVFKPMRFVDSPKQLNFNYTINVIEKKVAQ